MKNSFTKCIGLLCLFTILLPANPRVTIITPFHSNDNVEVYLQDITQDSFVNSNAELFFISNNYSPETEKIVSDFCAQSPTIHFISGDSETPMSVLYNDAIKQSSAPLLTIINIGDYRYSNVFDQQLQELENNENIDLGYSDYALVYENIGYKDQTSKWYGTQLPEYNSSLLYFNLFGSHFIWRKSLHDRFGFLKESFRYEYFWEFWNRCASKGASIQKLSGVSGNYFHNYFYSRPIFFNEDDVDQGYREDKYIRQTYKNYWKTHHDLPEKRFVIISASYNNKHWHKRNLDSVFEQNYSNWRMIYVDDCSPDQTGKLVEEYAQFCNKQDKITVISNRNHRGATANIYLAAHLCEPDEIIVSLDGDDWLAHPEVLNHLNALYQDPNVWLTYGQFQWWPNNAPGFCMAVPPSIHAHNRIREYSWVTTALRTFYAGLYHRIRMEDLLFNNEFLQMTGDLAIMFPMVEMAGHHCKFVNEILYIYNTATNINDHKLNVSHQTNLGGMIRNKPRYQPLEKLF